MQAGDLDGAEKILSPSVVEHQPLLKRIVAERTRLIEERLQAERSDRFRGWSVGPAKIGRSLPKIREDCGNRQGDWKELADELTVCALDGRAVGVKARGDAAVGLLGFYAASYVRAGRLSLFENEKDALTKAFGPPAASSVADTVPATSLRWTIADDALIVLAQSSDGSVVLAVGYVDAVAELESQLDEVAASVLEEEEPEPSPGATAPADVPYKGTESTESDHAWNPYR